MPRSVGKVYFVKELFYTLQGEGANFGRPAVFCRFAGCNLWSGREQDRESAICSFCDTDFVGTDGPGGGRFNSSESLARAVVSKWPDTKSPPFAVFTGGEPLLQMDAELISRLHSRNVEIAVETNGTIAAPNGIDWLTVSPKAGAPFVQKKGSELKLVFPQEHLMPDDLDCENLEFQHFFLQPMDGPNIERNTRLAIEYCLKNPKWRLSLQTHKIIGIP